MKVYEICMNLWKSYVFGKCQPYRWEFHTYSYKIRGLQLGTFKKILFEQEKHF